MKSRFDGTAAMYVFGPLSLYHSHRRPWETAQTSLAKAIRAFRVSATFPHQYSTAPIKTHVLGADGREVAVFRSSEPGAVVPVHVLYTERGDRKSEHVADIPPEGLEAEEYKGLFLPAMISESVETALVPTGVETGLSTVTRREIETRQLELQARIGELEKLKHDLALKVAILNMELKRRMEEIWLIELFLGSNEEVHLLANGSPAPASEPIQVYQRVLCMDEEIAVHQWLTDPNEVGEFEATWIGTFDRWVVSSPSRLNAIIPSQKGIVALRPRRKAKHREAYDYASALENAQREAADRQTYILVRNGEQVFRILIDLMLWPRFFPRIGEIDLSKAESSLRDRWAAKEMQEKYKNALAGMVLLQGLVERSDILHPLPRPDLNIFDQHHADEHFRFVRDDEEVLALTDGNPLANLTWKGYWAWLKEQLREGIRVLYFGLRDTSNGGKYQPLYDRTGVRLDEHRDWPSGDVLYTLINAENRYWGRTFGFKYYPPAERFWDPETGEARPRKNRVTFGVYSDEVLPYDFLSWRVVRHLLMSRADRENYTQFFQVFGHWYKLKKAEVEREKPFVDLVLRTALGREATEVERARCERLVRWWKIKTKETRDLGADEPKAFRMILAAWNRGEDFDNDPEKLLMEVVP